MRLLPTFGFESKFEVITMRIILIIIFGCITLLTGTSAAIDYTKFDQLLKKYVHDQRVDYTGLLTEKDKLLQFTQLLGTISPDSHPEEFPTDAHKLAYWINAYNAFILQLIIEHYPVASIKDINFIGFTVWLHRNITGGEEISFKALEDDIIRARFRDPRIHFAINCASVSCPPLAASAYQPVLLNKQLDTMTTAFINDPANFHVDELNRTIYLSAIFNWYENDFLTWLSTEKGYAAPTLLDYIALYYSGPVSRKWDEFELIYYEYDWSLNDTDR